MASDEAFAVLSSIAPEVRDALRHGATEQDARLQIIDRILTSVLNWPHNQIHTEVHNSRGFADYALIDDNKRHVAVLEAKKTGLLRIDTAAKSKTDAKLSGPVLRHASDGVSQAIDYCTDLGTSYGIVTDGNGWIFFRATRTDGLPPKEGKAIIFPCFDAVLEDFPTFYELSAREAVTQKLNFARLNSVEGLISRPREQRYFVRAPDEARLSPRSELGRDVAEVFNRFFAGISSEQDEEMRRACFVETRESREADVTLTKIASHLTNTIREIETERSQALQSEIETVISSQIAEVC
jgi:predicted type IV restriction endonuclease